MNPKIRTPKSFRLIGNKYNHYIDHDHFMGRDVFSDFWDSKNRTPIVITPDKKQEK